MDKNNQNEKANLKPHYYLVREKVLVRKKNEDPYKFSYQIIKVCKNRTVTIHCGAVQERINIIIIKSIISNDQIGNA